MKQTLLVLTAVLGLTMSAFAGNYSGYDADGNWVHGRFDSSGNYSGYDGRGNWYHGHVDSSGNYSGYDGNGNWVHGHVDPN